jgi:type IV fimbrial biogenesis protein FimT
VTTATAISTIDLNNVTAGNNFRALRIQIGRGGSLRLCEPNVTDATDPRRC